VVASIKRGSGRSRARLRIAALLAGVSLSAVAAHAQDATWTPPSGPSADWNTGSNWTPGTVPTNTAFFGAANATTVTFTSSASINTLQFNPGAPLYTFSIGGETFTINGDLTLCGCAGGLTISGGAVNVNGFLGVSVFGGMLAVTNGAALKVAADLLVADRMNITGPGSTVTVSGFTGVGIFGPGWLTIASGGVLNSQSGAEIDNLPGFPGFDVVDGARSRRRIAVR
jgi:T5SS/PEP-CTERM-associated repeat protein